MKSKYFIMLLVAIISIITFFILLPFLPQEIPAHYNYLGEVDRYGSKYEDVIWPISVCVMELIFIVIGKTQKKKNSEKQENIIAIVGIAFGVMLYILQLCFTLLELSDTAIDGENVNIWGIISIAEGILFLIIGNFLPKLTKNKSIGLRLPWTLKNPEGWLRGQKFAGRVFVISGLVLILIGIVFEGTVCEIIQMCVLIVWVVVLFLGSAVKSKGK